MVGKSIVIQGGVRVTDANSTNTNVRSEWASFVHNYFMLVVLKSSSNVGTSYILRWVALRNEINAIILSSTNTSRLLNYCYNSNSYHFIEYDYNRIWTRCLYSCDDLSVDIELIRRNNNGYWWTILTSILQMRLMGHRQCVFYVDNRLKCRSDAVTIVGLKEM